MQKRTVFITGASRGIGQAIAERFRSAEWEVIAPSRADLDLASAKSVATYLQSQPDLKVDVLINNAGENKINPLEKIEFSDWERMLQVNLSSSFQLLQHFSKGMVARGWGRVVNISSCYSVVSRTGRMAYTATKSGVNGMTVTAAVELGEKGVLVNAVLPGFVRTEMTSQNNSPEQIQKLLQQTAVKRMAEPNEIAEFVFFLGSEKNTFITGQSLLIDGGFTCF